MLVGSAWLWLTFVAMAADPFAACDAAFAAAPSPYDGWRCYYMAARKGGSWEVASAKLQKGADTGDAWAEVVLGHVCSDQGQPSAEEHYSHAIAWFEAHHVPAGSAQARFGLANFRWHKGTPSAEVLAILVRALADAKSEGDPLLIATAQAQLARHRWRTSDDLDAAWALASDAERVAFPSGPYQLRLLVLHTLAGIAELTARPDEELDLRRRMVALAAEEGDVYVEASARANVAQLYLNSPDDARAGAAESEARLALDAAKKADNAYGLAGAWCTLGRALGPAHPEAEGAWKACISGYAGVGAPEAALYGKSGLSTVQFRTDPVLALATADAAVADAHTAGARDAELEARLVAAALRWQAGASDARAATEAVISEMEATRDKQGTEEARASVGAMWRFAYDLLASRLLDIEEVDAAFVVFERFRARELHEQLVRAGGVAASPAAAEGARIATVQAALREDEAFVSYELPAGQTLVPDSDARSCALVVTKTEVRVVELPRAAGLARRIAAWQGLLSRRDGSEGGNSPFSDWITPVEASFTPEISRVVVVPDGALLRASLSGVFGERAVSVVPSAAVWLRLRETAVPGRGVLGVADPALPRAEAEVLFAVDRLGGRTELAAGELPADFLNFTLLHFATHAVADITHPERSELRLGRGTELHPHEIAALGLSGQVVVLSACSGTEGRAVGGEGVFGLARAFLAGGARVVVGSRWPLRDSESSVLVAGFMDALGDGVAVDVALAIAQGRAKSAGLPRAAWLGFVAVGDGSVVPFPGGVARPVRSGVVAALAAVAAVVLVAVRKLRGERRPRRTNRTG